MSLPKPIRTPWQSHRYRYGILTVIIPRPDDEPLHLQMDVAHQKYTHHRIKVEPTPTASVEVTKILKAKFENDNPGLNLSGINVDVKAIANYVEHQLRLLENDNLFESGVRWSNLGVYGVCIIVLNGPNPPSFNTNEQRYMHQIQMCKSLIDMRRQLARPGNIDVQTVQRVRAVIKSNLYNHPRDQIDHWIKVDTPYLRDEVFTVDPGPIYNASGLVTGYVQ